MAELVRFTFDDGGSRGYFERNYVNQCVQDAFKLIGLVKVGMHELTALEGLAIRLIAESANYWCNGDLSQLPLANAGKGEWIFENGKVVRGK